MVELSFFLLNYKALLWRKEIGRDNPLLYKYSKHFENQSKYLVVQKETQTFCLVNAALLLLCIPQYSYTNMQADFCAFETQRKKEGSEN